MQCGLIPACDLCNPIHLRTIRIRAGHHVRLPYLVAHPPLCSITVTPACNLSAVTREVPGQSEAGSQDQECDGLIRLLTLDPHPRHASLKLSN